jgi:hypothetical protein
VNTLDDAGLWRVEIEVGKNGTYRRGTVDVFYKDEKRYTDKADLQSQKDRRHVALRLQPLTGVGVDLLEQRLLAAWIAAQTAFQEEQNAKAAAEAEAKAAAPPTASMELLDGAVLAIRRPLCLVDGQSYAATWGSVQHEIAGAVFNEDVMLIVDRDRNLFADKAAPGARSIEELRIPVELPMALPSEQSWSGKGLKRYLAGDRPDPGIVFDQIVLIVGRFVDFGRSLGPQDVMCELVAAYVMATYLLDAFNVIGYLWPNGERGCGKTTLLHVVAQIGYLGQVILAGSTYSCLRDMAHYGAVLCFDDAEAVMDVRRTDPDKRALMLAGNRRGCVVSVKEPDGERGWKIKHIHTFCPRLFSAIREPDEVLGSRSIVVPLIRSADAEKAKSNVLEPLDWPVKRRRLIDDLWAVGLAYLPDLPEHDRAAARATELTGRNLEPWRAIFAVAHWLEHAHAAIGLFGRMKKLAEDYQRVERADFEDADRVRVLYRVLLSLSKGKPPEESFTIVPSVIASAMCALAVNEDLATPDKPFIGSRALGYLLKRQRFRRPPTRNNGKKEWLTTRREIEETCRAWGIKVES